MLAEIYKFTPILEDRIWGGNNLFKRYKKGTNERKKVGESWEISAIPNKDSVVATGLEVGKKLKELVEVYGEKLLGKKVKEKYGNDFPLLVKFLDTTEPLSIQVHPNDKVAQELGMPFGKTEFWYVLRASSESVIYAGFKEKTDFTKLKKSVEDKSVTNLLNSEKVQPGDVIYVPSGTVHSIGKDIVLLEVQQSSDCTYRIYDFDRKDIDGKPRELHLEESEKAINWKPQKGIGKIDLKQEDNKVNTIINNDFVTLNIIPTEGITVRDYSDIDSFVILTCLEGELELFSENGIASLVKGDVVLVAASTQKVQVYGVKGFKIVEVFMN